MACYGTPVTVIALNNHSYKNERNHIWNGAGRQFAASLSGCMTACKTADARLCLNPRRLSAQPLHCNDLPTAGA
jgi:hypothetical protein